MTLGIVTGNADQIVQASDRRLTRNGHLFDDSANKAGHAICDDASLIYCFTGIAYVGERVTTSQWLLKALYDAAQRDHRWCEIPWALGEEATRYFRCSSYLRGLPAAWRRLTIMLTGYTADDHIINVLISNFQDFVNFVDHPDAHAEFSVHAERTTLPASHNPDLVQAIGQFGALTEADERDLRKMLVDRRPAEAIRQKMIALIREVSDSPQAQGTVGKKINTVRLARAGPLAPISGYSSDEVEDRIPLLDQVNLCTGAPELLMFDAQISADSPVVFPRVHRNAPCPCGSGKKYRHCHGQRSSAPTQQGR
jgi:hypothetical protein